MFRRRNNPRVETEYLEAIRSEMVRIANAIERGERATARQLITEFVRKFADDPQVHMFAGKFYQSLGDWKDAALESALAALLEPSPQISGMIYHGVARALLQLNQLEVAKSVLEKGWNQYKSFYPRAQRNSAKEEYFKEYEDYLKNLASG